MRTYRPEVNGAPVVIGVEKFYLKRHAVAPQLCLEGEVAGVGGRAIYLPAAMLAPLREAGAVHREEHGRVHWVLPPGRPRWWRVQLTRPAGAQRLTVTLEPATLGAPAEPARS